MNHSAWINHDPVRIPGTDVTAWVARSAADPGTWVYSLWTAEDEFIASDVLPLDGLEVTPEQVARAGFLLSVEYA